MKLQQMISKNILLSLLCIFFACFCAWSLVWYRIGYNSWLYANTYYQNANFLDDIFSECAAMITYFLGGYAAIMFLGMMIVFAHKLYHHLNFSYQYIAWLLLPIIAAGYCSVHQCDMSTILIAGGWCGAWLVNLCIYLFGQPNKVVCINSMIICVVFVIAGSYIHHALQSIIRVLKHIELVQQMVTIKQICWSLVSSGTYFCLYKPLRYIARIISDMWTGELVIGIDATEYKHEMHHQELRTLYQDLMSADNDISICDDEQISREQIDQITVAHNQSNNREKDYVLPPKMLFGSTIVEDTHLISKELKERAHILEKKLERFGIAGTVVDIKHGPVVTLFEYKPEIDIKISKIIALEDDLAMALQAMSIRILAPIPGRSVIGFEVSNDKRLEVPFCNIFADDNYQKGNQILPLILGKDTSGQNVIADLVKMPHLLIAGSTGSGKSVALNVMLMSLLGKCCPEQLRLILIDPKRLEFMAYADIAHLLFPVITDAPQVIQVLHYVVQEMEERYAAMARIGVRNNSDFNRWAQKNNEAPFPFIVVMIDELSDLMLTVGKDIEDLLTRIAQMARAAGIHLIVATQRPSVDVITGIIKVNFASRIAFRVASRVDSRTILDTHGAEKLLGKGDMLFLDATHALLKRIHGAYVSNEEVAVIINHIRAQCQPQYHEIKTNMHESSEISSLDAQLYNQVLDFLSHTEGISISLLQRKFRIGYNRSARIIEMLELQGRIMPPDGSKLRKVIH